MLCSKNTKEANAIVALLDLANLANTAYVQARLAVG